MTSRRIGGDAIPAARLLRPLRAVSVLDGVKLRRSCGDMAIPSAPRIEAPWHRPLPDLYRLKRLSGVLCRIFERTPFGGDLEIVGDDIRRKYGVIDLSTKKQRKKGMGALSLPRRERTPLSATGAWVTVCQRSDNTAPSIPVVQGQTLQSEFFGEHSR